MKNPWKRYSKINPQREVGNRQIANDVFRALIAAEFVGADYKVIMAIIDKTWGYQKNETVISVKQFSEMTNLSTRVVKRTLKKLLELRVVYVEVSSTRLHTGSFLNNYAINKHYDTWIVKGCHPRHPSKGDVDGQRVTWMVTKGDVDGKERVSSTSPLPIKENYKENYKETPPLPPSQKSTEIFNQFWAAYPKKKSKGTAIKTWNQLKKTKKLPGIKILLNAIAAQKAGHDWQKQGGKFIPYPSTWLNAYGWDDECVETEKQPLSEVGMRTAKMMAELELN